MRSCHQTDRIGNEEWAVYQIASSVIGVLNMNAVGIDVSKGKSMVSVLRPFGEVVATPFEVRHTALAG